MSGFLFGAKSCHCGGCAICPHCSASCLSVTFAGWSGTGAANCDCADLNGTYLLTRGKARRVAINVSTATGGGAILWAVLGWDNATATHYVDGVDIEDGGTGYDPADTASVDVSSGEVVCDETPEVSLTISGGVVVGATVDTPGKLILNSTAIAGEPCVYCRTDNMVCDGNVRCRTICLEITDTERVLTVVIDGTTTIATGTIDAEDNPCDDMTFNPGDFTGSCTEGTVTVEAAECAGPPCNPCLCDIQNLCVTIHAVLANGDTLTASDKLLSGNLPLQVGDWTASSFGDYGLVYVDFYLECANGVVTLNAELSGGNPDAVWPGPPRFPWQVVSEFPCVDLNSIVGSSIQFSVCDIFGTHVLEMYGTEYWADDDPCYFGTLTITFSEPPC